MAISAVFSFFVILGFAVAIMGIYIAYAPAVVNKVFDRWSYGAVVFLLPISLF